MSGTAADIDEGTLDSSQLRWRSNRDGDLGGGESLSARLSIGTHIVTLEATDARGARGTDSVRVVVAAAPGEVDLKAPRLERARRLGPRMVALTFNEDVVGIGSRTVVAEGGGPITRIDYEPRAFRAIVHFMRAPSDRRLTVRGPLMDAAGNPIRTRTVTAAG